MSEVSFVFVVGLGLAFAAVVVLAGPPYSHLDCGPDGYTAYGTDADQLPLKDPDGMCEAKRAAIHPTIYDLRVHLEQQLGLREYVWNREDIPPPTATIWRLGDGETLEMPCGEAAEWIRAHPDEQYMVIFDSVRPVTHEPSGCAAVIGPAVDYADRVGDEA